MITIIENPDEKINLYPYIKKIPLYDITHEQLLSECLVCEHIMCKIEYDEEIAAVAVFNINNDLCFLLGVWAEHNINRVKKDFWGFLEEHGVKEVQTLSTRDPAAYAKLTGMERVYTVFSKKLGGL